MNNIICFEGPDSCGKTTLLNYVEEVLGNKLIVKRFKFPDYDGVSGSPYGKQIYNMLHSDKKNFENMDFLEKFAKCQIDDKIAAKEYIVKQSKLCDILLLDRFMISPLLYDAATLSCINPSFNIYRNIDDTINDLFTVFYSSLFDNALNIIEFLDEFKDIKYFLFDTKQSYMYTTFVGCERRQKNDALDTNTKIQTAVNHLYGSVLDNKLIQHLPIRRIPSIFLCDKYFPNIIPIKLDDCVTICLGKYLYNLFTYQNISQNTISSATIDKADIITKLSKEVAIYLANDILTRI
jgi:thymidylate kinase